jgi:hypothetical protein
MSSEANTQSNGKSEKLSRRQKFLDVFPIISKELVGYVKGEGMPEDAVAWYEKVGGAPSCTLSPDCSARCDILLVFTIRV